MRSRITLPVDTHWLRRARRRRGAARRRTSRGERRRRRRDRGVARRDRATQEHHAGASFAWRSPQLRRVLYYVFAARARRDDRRSEQPLRHLRRLVDLRRRQRARRRAGRLSLEDRCDQDLHAPAATEIHTWPYVSTAPYPGRMALSLSGTVLAQEIHTTLVGRSPRRTGPEAGEAAVFARHHSVRLRSWIAHASSSRRTARMSPAGTGRIR